MMVSCKQAALLFFFLVGHMEAVRYPHGIEGDLTGARKLQGYQSINGIRDMTDDPNYRRKHSKGHPSPFAFPKHLRAPCWTRRKQVVRVLVFVDASFCSNVGGTEIDCINQAAGVVRDASEVAYEPQFNLRLDPEVVTSQKVHSYHVIDDGLLTDPWCNKRVFNNVEDRLWWAVEWCRQINSQSEYGWCLLLTGCVRGEDGPTGVATGGFCNPESIAVAMDGVSAKMYNKGGGGTFSTVAHELGHNLDCNHTCVTGNSYGDTPYKWKNCGFLGNGYIADGQYYGFNEESMSTMCNSLRQPASMRCLQKDNGKSPSIVPAYYFPANVPTPGGASWIQWGPRPANLPDPMWCTDNVQNVAAWCMHPQVRSACTCLCSQKFLKKDASGKIVVSMEQKQLAMSKNIVCY